MPAGSKTERPQVRRTRHYLAPSCFDGDMIRISRQDFEDAVDDALDALPEEIAAAIAEANVAILVHEEPPANTDPHLLGLYVGTPLDQRGVFDGMHEPDHILIFRGPLQRFARSREELVEEITVTVVHELGHLFGISEQRLHELGWG